MSGYLDCVGVGDSRVYLKQIPDVSIDACVCDPPYDLCSTSSVGFMGMRWDATGIAFDPEFWKGVLRVLKPGAYLLACGGTRTYHRMAVAAEDAGFEITDSMMWLHGQGFPKSLDISKAIDSHLGAAATDAARCWNGWGTALKPAFEPIVVARKPSIGTYAENVLAHGTGALNIDGCRVGPPAYSQEEWNKKGGADLGSSLHLGQKTPKGAEAYRLGLIPAPNGRWPANVMLDQDAAKLLDESAGKLSVTGRRSPASREAVVAGTTWGPNNHKSREYPGDSGGPSRFFYTSKAGEAERWSYCRRCKLVFQHNADGAFEGHSDHVDDVTAHPTQKPLDLMRYLVKLVTQPGGVVIDPFCGTGTTAVAAKSDGFHFVTCDLTEDYARIAEARLAAVGAAASERVAGAYFCPGCKTNGELKLIEREVVERMRADGKKTTCAKCMKRYTYDEIANA